MGCIYAAVCFINMKIYIGQSIEYKKRIAQHLYSKEDDHFHRAIRKYGTENFGFCIIHDDIDSIWLDDWEIYYINFYNSFINGYNSTPGGKCHRGRKLSEETKQKISKSNKGRIITEETKQKLSKAHKGKVKTEEARLKISKLQKGRKYSEEAKLNMSKAQKGRIITEEARLKISNKLKGQKLSEETKQKISNTLKEKGKKHSEESKLKMSKNSTGKKQIIQYDFKMNKINTYESISEAYTQTEVNRASISMCCNGKRNFAGGFIWKFAESSEQV